MKRILLAVLLAAAPALAHDRHDRDDDDRWQEGDGDRREERRRWEDEQRRREEQRRWEEQQGRAEEERWERERYSWSEPPPAAPAVDFRNESDLAWNGQWIDTPEYGTVWQPTHVSSDWQPYRDGRWAWTDAGWAWVSDEPFGWAVYHYGRWAFSPAMGWYWIPGRVWAPAWVEWRFGDRYAGWCPLGPAGVAVVQPARWVWVETPHLLEPVRHHVVPLPARFAGTMTAPSAGPRAGPPVQVVERVIGRAVVPVAARTVLGSRAAPATTASPRAAPPAEYRGVARPHFESAPPARPQAGSGPAPRAQQYRPVTPAPVPAPAPRASAPQPRAAPSPTRAPAAAQPGRRVSGIAPPHARASW